MSEPLNLDAILEAINLLSEKKIEKANFNSTVVGVIRHCEDANSGAYLVEAENNTYIAYAIDREQFYKKDTPVYILKVGKDDLDKRFIVGSTETINVETIHQDKDLKYLDIVSQDLKTGYFNEITEKKNLAPSAGFISAVRKYGKIIIDSKVTYKSEKNELKNYGLEITLEFADGTSQIIYYDITRFIGNHLALKESQQRVFYKINNYEQFSGLTIKGLENSTAAEYKDLCVYPAIVDLTEEYGIEISGLEDYLYVDDDEDTVTLSAKTLLNHRDYLMIGAEYYWFIKDDSIKLEDDGYHPYGGNGWRCVNPYDDKVANWDSEGKREDLTEWFSQYNTLTLKYDIEKNDIFKNDINKIKCIVIYNNKKIESNVIDCYKLGSNSFSAKIRTENGEIPQIDTDSSLKLQCIINPELSEGFRASYLWYQDSKFIENSEILTVNGKNISQESSFICKIQIFYNQDLVSVIETPSFKVYSKEIELVTIVTYKRIWIKDFKKPLKYGNGKPYDDYWFGRERIILPKYYEIDEKAYLDTNGQWINYSIVESTDLKANFCLWECEGVVTVKKGEEPKEEDCVWSEPVIIDNSVSNEFKSPQLLQQYNTFANLTKGGTERGLYYQLDEEDNKQKLYINADFIKSGTVMADLIDVDNLETKNLVVTNGTNQELLRAVQADNEVIIGGFEVKNNNQLLGIYPKNGNGIFLDTFEGLGWMSSGQYQSFVKKDEAGAMVLGTSATKILCYGELQANTINPRNPGQSNIGKSENPYYSINSIFFNIYANPSVLGVSLVAGEEHHIYYGHRCTFYDENGAGSFQLNIIPEQAAFIFNASLKGAIYTKEDLNESIFQFGKVSSSEEDYIKIQYGKVHPSISIISNSPDLSLGGYSSLYLDNTSLKLGIEGLDPNCELKANGTSILQQLEIREGLYFSGETETSNIGFKRKGSDSYWLGKTGYVKINDNLYLGFKGGILVKTSSNPPEGFDEFKLDNF